MIQNKTPDAPTLGNIGQSSSGASFEAETLYKRIAKRRFALHRLEAELLPDEKGLQSCCLHAAPHAWISGNYIPETGQAFYGGLKHCDSPNCILCAPRRAEEARQKLTVLLAQCQRLGLFVYHLTFTLSHSRLDLLAEQYQTLQDAVADTFKGRWFMDFQEDVGYVGRIRSFENMWGENGWHGHFHILMIMAKPPLPERLESDLFNRYVAMLEAHGATASREHGLKVEAGHSALADYVSKYGHDPILDDTGIETEITQGRLKQGKLGSLTPFELLAAAAGENEPLQKIMEATGGRYAEARCIGIAEELFIENFDAMKGNPRVVWSKGLWKKLQMDEAWDWYQANQPKPEIEVMIDLDPSEGWKSVRGDGKTTPDLRGDLLTEIKSGDLVRIRNWLTQNHIKAIIYPDRDGGRSGKSYYI